MADEKHIGDIVKKELVDHRDEINLNHREGNRYADGKYKFEDYQKKGFADRLEGVAKYFASYKFIASGYGDGKTAEGALKKAHIDEAKGEIIDWAERNQIPLEQFLDDLIRGDIQATAILDRLKTQLVVGRRQNNADKILQHKYLKHKKDISDKWAEDLGENSQKVYDQFDTMTFDKIYQHDKNMNKTSNYD